MFTKNKQKKKHKLCQLMGFTVVFPYTHKSDIGYLHPPFFIPLPLTRTWWKFLIGCTFMFSSPKSPNNRKISKMFSNNYLSVAYFLKKKRGRSGGRKREREHLLSNPLVSFPLSWGDISTVFPELTRLRAA